MKTVYVQTPEGVKEVSILQIKEAIIERKWNYPGWQVVIAGKHYHDSLEEPQKDPDLPFYKAEDIIYPDVEIYAHAANPLSNQLIKITGDSLNILDFEYMASVGLLRHNRTGLIIRTYSADKLK